MPRNQQMEKGNNHMKDDYDGRAPPDILKRLHALKAACGSNKNDCVDVLIEACVAEGLDTRSQIVRALRELGFGNDHVNIRLNKGTGVHPEGFRWSLGANGRYTLLDQGNRIQAGNAAEATD